MARVSSVRGSRRGSQSTESEMSDTFSEIKSKNSSSANKLPALRGPPGLHDFTLDDDYVQPVYIAHAGPTGRVVLTPPPLHVRWNPPSSEPILLQRPNLQQDMYLLEAARTDVEVGPEAVVFDSCARDVHAQCAASLDSLVFESRFESGNLCRAVRVGPTEYDLFLANDYGTLAHTQWFYFQVSNYDPGCAYKLNIVNLRKKKSLYNKGLQPLLYSDGLQAASSIGWHRAGTDVAYYRNLRVSDNGRPLYTLTFTLSFPPQGGSCYLAHCYPYTYTDLCNDLEEMLRPEETQRICKRRKLAKTQAGNVCEVLTITANTSDPAVVQRRRGIIFSARVHPGETNASWMMRGLIQFLLSPSKEAASLRDQFVFKVVPMLNPDGVIIGNYRCSLSGHDLNRRWRSPDPSAHSTIYHFKELMASFLEDRQVVLFCDLHGHSARKNIFIYGCDPKYWKGMSSRPPWGMERVFPWHLSQVAECFSFDYCRFGVKKSKESTGRVVGWRQFHITRCYTLEASFCGADFGSQANVHFNCAHYERMGTSLGHAVMSLLKPTGPSAELIAYLQAQERHALVSCDGDHSDDSDDDSSSEDEAIDDPLPLHNESSSLKRSSKSSKHKRSSQKQKPPPPPAAPAPVVPPPVASAPASSAPARTKAVGEGSSMRRPAKSNRQAMPANPARAHPREYLSSRPESLTRDAVLRMLKEVKSPLDFVVVRDDVMLPSPPRLVPPPAPPTLENCSLGVNVIVPLDSTGPRSFESSPVGHHSRPGRSVFTMHEQLSGGYAGGGGGSLFGSGGGGGGGGGSVYSGPPMLGAVAAASSSSASSSPMRNSYPRISANNNYNSSSGSSALMRGSLVSPGARFQRAGAGGGERSDSLHRLALS